MSGARARGHSRGRAGPAPAEPWAGPGTRSARPWPPRGRTTCLRRLRRERRIPASRRCRPSASSDWISSSPPRRRRRRLRPRRRRGARWRASSTRATSRTRAGATGSRPRWRPHLHAWCPSRRPPPRQASSCPAIPRPISACTGPPVNGPSHLPPAAWASCPARRTPKPGGSRTPPAALRPCAARATLGSSSLSQWLFPATRRLPHAPKPPRPENTAATAPSHSRPQAMRSKPSNPELAAPSWNPRETRDFATHQGSQL
mmetsp:Transcript_107059/g.341639  ORF Transcript_107059/g.341639 Transcript_107059/m.341639 type:complete len:259 (+) Transcript_107059:298-1074(+)